MSRSTTATTSRWCPSPEQLMILEELYRRGLKTPNSSQIQKITSHLSLHGKIQGKNVFYWFQNHKARDRQKLRKKLMMMMMMHQQQEDAHMYLHHHPTYYINNPFNHKLPTNYYYQAQKNLHYPQCTAALDKEGHGGLMRRTWRSSSDVQKKDCFNTITSCCQPVTINYMDVGPSSLNASLSTCFINNNKDRPLQTLELFPLKSSSKESKS